MSARAMMMAVGCIQAQKCHTDRCPTGVATQNPRFYRGLDPASKGERVFRYHRATVTEVAQMIATLGARGPQDLSPTMLRRRISQTEVVSYASLYNWLEPDELLTDPPRGWAGDWERADAESFGAVPEPITPTGHHVKRRTLVSSLGFRRLPDSVVTLDTMKSPQQNAPAEVEATLLVVDDEPNIRELLSTSLRFAGFDVLSAANGTDALRIAEQKEPDLLVLDVMLPDMDGFAVTRRLRQAGKHIPVVFLTARDDTSDKITGLTVGGDDYVTKPFSLEEVVARIRAVLRRTHSAEDEETAVIEVSELELDDDTHEVRRGGILIDLSPTEFKLLRYLMLNANRVLSKSQILDHVWEYDFGGDTGIVESYISYLRRKIDVAPTSDEAGNPIDVEWIPMIQTKRGVGYMLRTPDSK